MAHGLIRLQVVALLLENGADVNSVDDMGNAALHWASARGMSESTWWCASVSSHDPSPNVAGILNICIRLIEKNANLDIANKQVGACKNRARLSTGRGGQLTCAP